jgi:hypothetical protein
MTTIPIERLRSPTIIHRIGGDFGPFGAFAEVQDIQFDGQYTITARFLWGDDDHVGETEVRFIVEAGETVDFGGRGEPKLRPEADVLVDEWQAKIEANDYRCLSLQGKINANLGYLPPVDEARRQQFYDAMERALAPSLEAAE